MNNVLQFYKRFMSGFSWVYAHILWRFIKTNSINFFHESWLMTHENQFYKILYESRLIFHEHTKTSSVFMKNHKINLYRTVFYESWISWAWTHDMSLDSYLWRFIEIFLWAFIELTPGIKTQCIFFTLSAL